MWTFTTCTAYNAHSFINDLNEFTFSCANHLIFVYGQPGEFACRVTDFVDDDRVRVVINKRDVVIFQRKDKYYAMDAHCFHQGGALYAGDIEDIDGRPCVKCPSHRYRICIENGERFMELHETEPPTWQSRGIRQRTHTVFLKDDKLFVRLSSFDKPFDSDKYNDGTGTEK
ncbi:Rieske domain-containing protein-like [Liolophura sinensis]|uniref:Rieske domain-containing protein-like n=1 Tax=Liolophura sinensis TaxID=3198878 RepID=UPI003158853D